MTISELTERLQSLVETGVDPNTPVRLAVQPTWPLNYSVDGVTFLDSDETGGRPNAVWIAASHSAPDGENPYAPQEAWEERWEW